MAGASRLSGSGWEYLASNSPGRTMRSSSTSLSVLSTLTTISSGAGGRTSGCGPGEKNLDSGRPRPLGRRRLVGGRQSGRSQGGRRLGGQLRYARNRYVGGGEGRGRRRRGECRTH